MDAFGVILSKLVNVDKNRNTEYARFEIPTTVLLRIQSGGVTLKRMGESFLMFRGIVVPSTLKHFDCFISEEKGNMTLPNVGSHSPNDTSQPRKSKSYNQGNFGYEVHEVLVGKPDQMAELHID